VDSHHVIEAAGIVAFGLVFYSYARVWLDRLRLNRVWRVLVTGLAFGGLAVVLMISRIQISDGLAIDARAVPIALIALVEGGPASLVAALPAAAYRLWLGGSGRGAGLIGIFGTVVVATLVAAWARRDGGVRLRHTLALSAAVYAVTALSFFVLGARGVELFGRVWGWFLVLIVAGIGGVGRLLTDIGDAQAAEAARREAEALRAVNMLARTAAHEINNPLMVVTGSLALLAKGLPRESEDAKRAQRAQEGAERIRDIVAQMNQITKLEEDAQKGHAPDMLDIRKSSKPAEGTS
jgi:signal transduction histidine kinase